MAACQHRPCLPTWHAAAGASPGGRPAIVLAAPSLLPGRVGRLVVRAAAEDVLDTIDWPEGARPKRGGVTKAALAKLRVDHLRLELCKRSQRVSGTKAVLVERLLAVLPAPDTPAPAAAAEEESVAGPGPSSEAAAAADAATAGASSRSKGRKAKSTAVLERDVHTTNRTSSSRAAAAGSEEPGPRFVGVDKTHTVVGLQNGSSASQEPQLGGVERSERHSPAQAVADTGVGYVYYKTHTVVLHSDGSTSQEPPLGVVKRSERHAPAQAAADTGVGYVFYKTHTTVLHKDGSTSQEPPQGVVKKSERLSPAQAAADTAIVRPFFAPDEDEAAERDSDWQADGAAAARKGHGHSRDYATPAPSATLPSDVAMPTEAEALAALGIDAASLPPFTGAGSLGAVFTDDEMQLEDRDWQNVVVLANNRSGMQMTFLGTSAGMGSPSCNAPSLALVRPNDMWLFDAGEDTQRQLFKANHIKPSKMVRIFISARAPERLLGLPGMLCTLGMARERGHESADIPIHVFGPSGVAEFLATMFQVSDTYLECPVLVHEFALGPVDPEDIEPSLYNRRAKIYRSLLPPDQLNPNGWIDAGLDRFMPTQGRATREKGARASGGVLAHDLRAGFTPPPLPPPGSPDAHVEPGDMTWTLKVDVQGIVTAALVGGDGGAGEVPTWGFVVQEAARHGNLSVERAQALRLFDRSVYASLKDGHPAANDQGILIPPSLVVSPVRPGRRLAIVPQICTNPAIERLIQGVDVLVAGFGVQGAADVARRVAARHVVLTGMDSEQLLGSQAATSNADDSPVHVHVNGAVSGAEESGYNSAVSVAGTEVSKQSLVPGALGSSGHAQQQELQPVQAVLPPGGRALAVQDLVTVILDKHEGTDPANDLAASIAEYVKFGLQGQTPRMSAAEKAAQSQREGRHGGRPGGRGGRGGRGGGGGGRGGRGRGMRR